MKLQINGSSGKDYYIATEEAVLDSNVAKELKLSLEEYHKILLTYNAYQYLEECYFRNKDDIDEAIKTLRYVMILLEGIEV